MGDLFGLIVTRFIIRFVGRYSRYYYYRIIGKSRTLKSLSNESNNPIEDTGNAVKQDFFNAIVGSAIIVVIFFAIIKLLSLLS